SPLPLPVGNQNGGGVPVPPAIVPSGVDQPVDLLLGQIFPHAPTNCYTFYRRSPIVDVLIFHGNRPPLQGNCYNLAWKCNSVNHKAGRAVGGVESQHAWWRQQREVCRRCPPSHIKSCCRTSMRVSQPAGSLHVKPITISDV